MLKKIKFFKYASLTIFVIALLANVYYSFVGIDNYLLENFHFRQTQTALTAYYFVKDGFKLAYETPVVGAPWAIPFEFPLYQGIVAVIKKMMPNYSLDMIGRLVSLLFFYLGLIYVYKIMIKYIGDWWKALFILSFILIHPIYIFWSRSFMIELTALFFCLFYIYYSLDYLKNKSVLSISLAFIGALLGALVKITTFIPFVFLLSIILFREWWKEKGYEFKMKILLRYFFYAVVFFIIPVIVAKIWVDYTDYVKSFNKYANHFTSSANLKAWNFGTLKQKLSLSTWIWILKQSQRYSPLFYSSVIIALIWIIEGRYKYWMQSLVCLGLDSLTPAIFTNLHYVHEYYTYSNSLFLSMCLGFIVLSFFETEKVIFKTVGITFAVCILLFFVCSYRSDYYKVQLSKPDFMISTANFVKQHTKPDDVIFIYGVDWGSEYAYYTERRCIDLRNTFKSVKDTDFVDIMQQNKQYNIPALVLVTNFKLYNEAFENELINYMGFNNPVLQKKPYYVFMKK